MSSATTPTTATARVVGLTVHHVRIPLRKALRHASYTRTETDNVIVCCRLEDGTEGFGEGVPREYVTGETIDTTLDLLRRSDFTPLTEVCHSFEQAVGIAERFQVIAGDDERACQGNAARCAVELALMDAYGKAFKTPLSTVTQLLAPDLYEPRPWVRYSGVIAATQGRKILFAALRLWIWGFRQIKVKVGIEGQDDVKRLAGVRCRVDRKMEVRLDANEAWTPEEAVEKIRALEQFHLSAVEQPVPHSQTDALAEVRRQVKVPIMLDESLCSMRDAERAVEKQTADLFNLRLSKCGGFIPTLRLAQFAKRHNIGCQLGCQVGETSLLSAAGRHFASSVSGLFALEGSYDRHLVREPLGQRDITFRWGGWAPALTGPGLGIEIDRTALDRVTVRKEALLG